MATASISGLGSGLDTASIVSQLMQLERVQQTKLKNRVSTEQSTVQILQNLNTRFATLATTASTLGKAESWDALSTTSSSEGVSVKAGSGASVTSFSAKVLSLATSHGETYTDTAALTDVLVPVDADSGKRLLSIAHQDGTTTTVDTGDGSLRSVVDALNSSANATGVRANMLQVSEGSYRLVVDATATGSTSSFTLTAADGSALLGGAEAARTRGGSDAKIEISGFTLVSKSNTFTDVMPDVSVTLTSKARIDESVELGVTRDAAKQSQAVKSFVADINALLTEIDTRTAYNPTSKSAGALSGDSVVRSLRDSLASTIFPADGTSMADLGVQVDRSGKLVFDEEAFAAAYAADPAKVAAGFSVENGGFAARVKEVADRASDRYNGSLSSAIQGRNDSITRLNDSISQWDLRLELREIALSRQFSALDVALSNMNSQSAWLSGQLNSLSSSGN